MDEPPSLERSDTARGVAYGVAAYGFWGIVPVFWKQLGHVSALETLAHRTIWGLLSFVALGAVTGQLGALRAAARNGRVLATMALSGALLSCNWLTFIHAVDTGRLLHASLGYFINPLVSVLLGMIVLRERLRAVQWLALALACAGVAQIAAHAGSLPWIALVLAGTFGLYGLLRKTAAVGSLPGSALETAFMAPLGVIYLASLYAGGDGATGHADAATHGLLVATGVVTALPLLWFTSAARRLSLTTIGFLQYLAPTGQLLLAVLAYGEPFTALHMRSFACIWAALAVFSGDALWRASQARAARTRYSRSRSGS